MAELSDLANKLAEECIAIQDEIGNPRLFVQLGEVLGTASQTLEEAFLTAVRTRMAAAKGHAFLRETLDAHRKGAGSSG